MPLSLPARCQANYFTLNEPLDLVNACQSTTLPVDRLRVETPNNLDTSFG